MTSIPINKGNITECGLSGWMVPFGDTVLLWNGVRVYKRFYEARNPQDFIPDFVDEQSPPIGTLSENNSNAVVLGGGMLTEDGQSMETEQGDEIMVLEETE